MNYCLLSLFLSRLLNDCNKCISYSNCYDNKHFNSLLSKLLALNKWNNHYKMHCILAINVMSSRFSNIIINLVMNINISSVKDTPSELYTSP